MTNVYIKPQPEARVESAPVLFYTVHHHNGRYVSMRRYRTEKEAIDIAKELGFIPLVARVRIPYRRNPNHWQPAPRTMLCGSLMPYDDLQRKNA